MRYVIEDTDTGFRMTLERPDGTPIGAAIEVPGSHSPLATLYGEAERSWESARADRRAKAQVTT